MDLIPENAVDALQVRGKGASKCRIGLSSSTSPP